MNLKKPKFWDYKKPNIYAYCLLPIAYLLQILNFIKFKTNIKTKSFKIKTICIGNIYIGGTGKTSLSIRINAINQAEDEKFDVAILDDGLQDQTLTCNINFVCFNNINWKGNGFTIPAGPLRENIKKLKKYDHVFLNGNNDNLSHIKKEILIINPNINIHIGLYEPTNINKFDKNNQYLVFSGIGNHQTFVSMIKENGLNISKDIEFPDHYKYTNNDINQILNQANTLNSKIITTEKDYLRLENNKTEKIDYIKSTLKIVDENKLINTILDKYEAN